MNDLAAGLGSLGRSPVRVPWGVLLPTLYPLGVIPLSDVAWEFFNLSDKQAKDRAAAQDLEVPCFRLGSQKSPWVIAVDDFVALVERRSQEAYEIWKARNEEAA